jgi:hypothetical protein
MHSTDSQGGGYEKRDAQIRPLVESGIVLVVLCLASFWSMIYLHHWLQSLEQKKEPAGNALTPAREVPPAPLLQVPNHVPMNWAETNQLEKPFYDSTTLSDVRTSEARLLDGYWWVDEQSKLVHIPIQQAMQKLLEQGLPVRK